MLKIKFIKNTENKLAGLVKFIMLIFIAIILYVLNLKFFNLNLFILGLIVGNILLLFSDFEMKINY